MKTRRSFVGAAAGGVLGLVVRARSGRTATSFSPSEIAPFLTPYKYGKLVLEKSGISGRYDANLVDCPFPFSVGGRYYLMHIGHDGIGYQTGLATSEDLVNWQKIGVIFGRDPKSKYFKYNAALTSILRDDDISSPAPLKKIGGRYLGCWHAYPKPGYEQGAAVIGLAWSDDFKHWEAGEPILRPEDGAAWERGGLYKGYLVEKGGTYYMFYNAKNVTEGNWHEQTGVAMSQDLKRWTRYRGNPINRNGPAGAWDEHFASDPVVVRRGNTWALYYFGLSADGKARDLLALGRDPFHFTKIDKIMVDVGPPGSVDETFAHKPGIISADGNLYHFYCAVSGGASLLTERRGISVARPHPW